MSALLRISKAWVSVLSVRGHKTVAFNFTEAEMNRREFNKSALAGMFGLMLGLPEKSIAVDVAKPGTRYKVVHPYHAGYSGIQGLRPTRYILDDPETDPPRRLTKEDFDNLSIFTARYESPIIDKMFIGTVKLDKPLMQVVTKGKL